MLVPSGSRLLGSYGSSFIEVANNIVQDYLKANINSLRVFYADFVSVSCI